MSVLGADDQGGGGPVGSLRPVGLTEVLELLVGSF